MEKKMVSVGRSLAALNWKDVSRKGAVVNDRAHARYLKRAFGSAK